jgi:cell division transport system permease protein
MWFRLHALAWGEALRRIAAQPFAAAASILVLGLALALPVIGAMLLRSVTAATAQFDTDPHINVYLVPDASDDDAKRVGDVLRANAEAASVRFVSRTQAIEELRATTHLAEILATLDKNPLPHAFTVRVRSTDPARLQAAKDEWSKLPRWIRWSPTSSGASGWANGCGSAKGSCRRSRSSSASRSFSSSATSSACRS